MNTTRLLAAMATTSVAVTLAACGGSDEKSSDTAKPGITGAIAIDGSSTVFPLAQAAAEAFQEQNPDVKITVGESGTGGGFEKFCKSETDLSNASRPIKDEEIEACKAAKIEPAELLVANDGIAIVANPALKVTCLTTAQLKKLWATDAVTDYKQLGVSGFAGKASLYGPGTDSGTFDFFTDVINGEEGVSRKKYQASEDDNVLVQGVAGDPTGIGYFGFSYYEQNADKLKLLQVDAGDGCVTPSKETIQDGTYKPLSRPLFTYASAASAKKPEVKAFLQFLEDDLDAFAEKAQFVPLTPEQATESKSELAKILG